MKLNWVNSFAFAAALATLTACTSAPSTPAGSVELRHEVIYLEGYLSHDLREQLQAVSNQHPHIAQLEVNSQRGDPMAAMQMGYFIQQRGLQVIVNEYCLEACANYLFTAAPARYVGATGVVAWNGGALEQSWVYQWQSYILPGVQNFVTRYADTYLRRETRFFQRINVDQHVTTYGFHPRIGCATEAQRGFFYSEADLLSMGVAPTYFADSSDTYANYLISQGFCQVDLVDRLLLIN